MRRSRKARIGLGALAMALPLSLIGCSKDDTTASTGNSTTTAVAPVNAGQTVEITGSGKDFAFDPKTVTVKAGTTITFHNGSASKHTVKTDDGQAVKFASDTLASDQTFVYTPDKPGTYTYFCSIHTKEVMSGSITVTS